MQRAVLSALIVIEVHAKDVAAKLVKEAVASVNDFEWISQLRSGNSRTVFSGGNGSCFVL